MNIIILNDVQCENLDVYVSLKPFLTTTLVLYQYNFDSSFSTHSKAFFKVH